MPGLTTGPPSPSPTYVGTTAHIPRGGGRGGGCRGGGEGEGEKREGDEYHPVLPTLFFFFLLTYRTTRPFFLPSSCSCSFSSSLHGWETHCDNFPLPVPLPLLRTPYERGDKQVPSWKEVHFHFDFFLKKTLCCLIAFLCLSTCRAKTTADCREEKGQDERIPQGLPCYPNDTHPLISSHFLSLPRQATLSCTLFLSLSFTLFHQPRIPFLTCTVYPCCLLGAEWVPRTPLSPTPPFLSVSSRRIRGEFGSPEMSSSAKKDVWSLRRRLALLRPRTL